MNKTPRQQRGQARVKLPEREQVEMRFLALDQMIRKDDFVRTVVRYVDSLDLSELYSRINATAGVQGRDAIDPRILFALWLFATLDGVNSARKLDRLTTRDVAYMWICGGVTVNYHTLADFRSNHGELLERILTDSIAVLHHQGLIHLETIAQDGMRVRASAGSGSFRTKDSLDTALQKAQQYVQDVRDEQDDEPKGRSEAARQRAAEEKLERIQAAVCELEELQKRHDKRNKGKREENRRSKPRASTTDPEARRMKMADGGFRPAYNVQFANDADALVIISVDVTNEGSDGGLLAPMYDDVCQLYGTAPQRYVADGGFSNKEGVTHVERNGTKFYGVLNSERKQLEEGKNPYEPRPRENAHYTAFRARMGTEEAKQIYGRRAPAAEFPNANCRNQGLHQFSVRGLIKTKAQSLWHALAYNIRRFANLRDEQQDRSYLELLMTT
jgi:transposase